MSESRTPWTDRADAELERALRDLGAESLFPSTPNLVTAVRLELAVSRSPVRFPVRRLLTAAAIVLVVIVAALTLSSGLRSTVADWIGVRGVRISFERETPPPAVGATTAPTTAPVATPTRDPATPIGANLLLGRSVTLAEAQASVPYQIHVPSLPGRGEPDEIYLRTLPDGNQMVSFIYLPTADLPETLDTGVGALLMQFIARNDVAYLGKQVSGGFSWLQVEVNGNDGLWIEGAHQLTLQTDPSEGCCEDRVRTAGNVLLWEQDGLTFRLESALNDEQALAIAESVSVAPATPAATPGN